MRHFAAAAVDAAARAAIDIIVILFIVLRYCFIDA